MQNYYFLSNIPCHLKINGNYIGEFGDNLKLIKSNDRLDFFEFLPIDDSYYSVYGNKNCNFMRIFKVDGGFLYHPVFLRKKRLPMKILFQKSEIFSFGEILITCMTDGEVKVFLDGYFSDVKTLPFIPNECEIKFLEGFVAILLKGVKTAVFLYDINSRKLCFSTLASEVSFSDVLTIENSYKTVTKTTLKETWSLSSEIKLLSKESTLEVPYRLINKNLLPLAFFENASIGASLKEIVTPSFYERSSSLKNFLGDVISATISPVNDGEIWLIENDCVLKGRLQKRGDLIDNVILDDF